MEKIFLNTIFKEKNHYYLNLKESTVKSIAIKLNSKLKSKLKIFVIDLNRNGWIGPYQNLNNSNLPKITDRIKSNDILLELIQDENEQLINPFIDILYFDNSSKRSSNLFKKKRKPTTLKRNHRRNILLCGYWPPSNECIRPFSRNQELNPEGWIGQNWEGSGFDVVSYFPTFSPADCNNCGQGNGNLQVDYQLTSEDWWNIVDSIQPIAIITFSRGSIDNTWELEWNYYNSLNWVDDFTTPYQPTPTPPDSILAADSARFSNLPMDSIVSNIYFSNLDLYPFIDYNLGAGNYLSEFIGYHGVWYRDLNNGDTLNMNGDCLLAGHIHVGGLIPWDTAFEAAKISLQTVINKLNDLLPILGDINMDGTISILDIFLLISFLSGEYNFNQIENHNADINFDSRTDIFDLLILSDNLVLGR